MRDGGGDGLAGDLGAVGGNEDALVHEVSFGASCRCRSDGFRLPVLRQAGNRL
jgi:hypothetical protein